MGIQIYCIVALTEKELRYRSFKWLHLRSRSLRRNAFDREVIWQYNFLGPLFARKLILHWFPIISPFLRYDINEDQWLPFTSIKKTIKSETVIPIANNSKIFIFIIEKSSAISFYVFNPSTRKLDHKSGLAPKLFKNPMPFIYNGLLQVYGFNVCKQKHEIHSYNHVADKWNVRR